MTGPTVAQRAVSSVRWLGMTVFGGVVGVLAKLTDGPVPGWVGDLGNYPAAYAVVLVVVARRAPSEVSAALHAGLFFVGLCLGYYGWSSVVLGFADPVGFVVWTGVALTIVPLFAAAVRWAAARAGVLPAAAIAVAAAVPLVDGVLQRLWALAVSDALTAGYPLHLAQAVFDVAVAALIIWFVPVDRSTRRRAALFVVPVAFALDVAVDVVRGALQL